MTRILLALLAVTALFTSVSPACAGTSAKLEGAYTVEWRQMAPVTETPAAALTIGTTEVSLRPLPKAKPKDPISFGLFAGDGLKSKTAIYPGKWYQFALVGRDGKTQLFVNGYPDATKSVALSGEVKPALPDVKITASAASDDAILANFKAALKPRAITTVGHRGVHMHAPENTRISYVQALAAKTPILEIDTALTKDGQIVLMHDKTVDRTTDGTGKVAEMTLAQLKKLDAGSWKDAKYKGEPVPTVDEIAELARGKASLMFDLKAEGQGKAIAAWLEKSKFPKDQVIVAPWEDAEGVAIRQHVKDVPMIRLTSKIPSETFDDAYFEKMKQTGFSGFSINWQYLSEAFVRAAQNQGMKVYVWTVNDAPDIAGAALLGVDGIVTDDPAATIKLLAGLSTTAPTRDGR